jgi:hypothetical protein
VGVDADHRVASPRRGGPGVGPFRRNLPSMIVAAVATIAVQVGTYLAARPAMGADGGAVLALLAGLLWLMLATPIFAAGGAGVVDALLRGGAVLDASAALLIVLVATSRTVTLPGAVKIYLIWCGLGVAECTLVLLSRRPGNGRVVAAVAIVLALAVAAAPFWANGVITAVEGRQRVAVTFIVKATNPVFATSGCLRSGAGFIWNEAPLLYECTVLGRDVPMPSAPWHFTFAAYCVLALCLSVLRFVRRPP